MDQVYNPTVASVFVRSASILEAAKIALTWDKMDSIYEVEEGVFPEKMPFFWVEMKGTNIWYHVGFTATTKHGNTSTSDASPKLLFGELMFDASENKLVPTCYSILEASSAGVGRRCGFCPPGAQFLHSSGYCCGAWEDPPPLEFTDESNANCSSNDCCNSTSTPLKLNLL